jgi:LuxR family maltose regulon positive regulatory protein
MVDPTDPELPLLGTKLRPPRRRRSMVERPRLTGAGLAGVDPTLTLVSAPAGFGKTTCVAQLFAGEPVAWLSLDPGDDDPVRFWTYVVAALSPVVPDLGAELAAMLIDPRASLRATVATLINSLEAAALDVVLVLDDYHVITSEQIHDSVRFLVEHQPDELHLVIASRADPPLPLASMRAAGALRELRAADLRFTADETAEYLGDAMGLTLSEQDVAVLEGRTEGWIAALQLAGLSMQGRADPAEFIAAFAGEDRFILDYLADEVLERQRPELRDFLLATSILGRLHGPLCAAVSGAEDAKALLDEVDRSNLFLVALDDQRDWYRYHHLFGDMLRARLHDEQPDRVAVLHRRASDWYAANDALREAVEHALAADDPAYAAALIERAAPAMTRTRQEATLRSWLEQLPDELYDERPVLTISLVGARMSTGDPVGVQDLLARAERWVDPSSSPIVVGAEEYARLTATIAMYRAALALLDGDLDVATEQAHRVLEFLGSSNPIQRGAAAALIGLAHWHRAELSQAHDRYAESIACFEAGGFLADVMGCSLALADIQITQGRLEEARRTFDAALRLDEGRQVLRGIADMHAGLSVLATGRNELDVAAQHLRLAAELGEQMGLPQHPYRWRVATAQLRLAEGDRDRALVLLEQAAAVYETDFSPPVRPVSATVARVRADAGDLDAATRWAASVGVRSDDELSYLREYEHLTLARVLLAGGQVDEATGLLLRLLTAAEQGRRTGSAIEALVLLAEAHQRAGRTDLAEAALRDALRRSDDEPYVRVFLDAGPSVIGLLRTLDGAEGAAAARVLATEPDGSPPRSRSSAADPDELSERELDVLRLLRGELSGPEIARELHVSLNTLRTHTKHIYAKLGATNRREAVRRAAELGL